MVTKRTGRPMGRPKKPRENAPKKDRGRPSVPFRQDPDRYLIAMVEAHAIVNRTSERQAAEAIAALQIGNEVQIPSEIMNGCPPGYIAVGWGPAHAPKADDSFINTKPGSSAATITGRAATLRQKLRESRKDIDNNHWRTNMAVAFALAMSPIKKAQEVKDIVMVLTAAIGETEAALNTILPMIDYSVSG